MRSYEKDSPPRPFAKASKLRAATPDESARRIHDRLDPRRDALGSLASLSERASGCPNTSRTKKGPTENRPPEAWRATVVSKADARAERFGRTVADVDRVDPMFEALGRASVRLGANKPEARVSRLLNGAGLLVSAREVRERSGIGPEMARALLDLALNPVRVRGPQLRATVSDLPRRSSDDPLS